MKTENTDIRCQHENFKANANIYRLTDVDDGPVKTFAADIKVNCIDCGMPFQWMGLKRGYDPTKPMVSFDKQELRAPLIPLEEL